MKNDDQITSLLKQSTSTDDRLKLLRGKVQLELLRLKDNWWEAKAAELQMHADEKQTKKFSDGVNTVYGPSSNTMTPVRSVDGTLLT
jgi:hypothetical protein